MSTILSQMYGVTSNQEPTSLSRAHPHSVQSMGRYVQLQVENQQVLVVHPQVIDSLVNTMREQERIILDLRDRMIRLQQQCTQQQNRILRLENQTQQGGIFD